MELIKQGAEARIHASQLFGRPTIIKERFSKSYRHPTLDKALTQRRVRTEVKCIQRCRANGIRCPAIYFVDQETNSIHMEYITNSVTVKDYITQQQAAIASQSESRNDSENANADHVSGDNTAAVDKLKIADKLSTLMPVAHELGRIIGTMHCNHIIHGDLTTSNLLLVGVPTDLCIAVIDFGLSSIDETAEDKAVDLYVLERALLSTHPSTEPLFEAILHSYKAAYVLAGGKGGGGKGGRKGGGLVAAADEILRKLDEVRLRGRKRAMVG